MISNKTMGLKEAGKGRKEKRVPSLVEVEPGRNLAYEVSGFPIKGNGRVVFVEHDLHGSQSSPKPRGIFLHRLGITLVTYDRPGHGDSDRNEGRDVASAARDVVAIADELGVDKFSVIGLLDGAPYALASAALSPDRVQKVVAIGALESSKQVPSDAPKDMTDDGTFSEASQAVEENPGMIDDAIALSRPWGFDASDISVPVSLWSATATSSDSVALQEAIPGATLVTLEGRSNLNLMAVFGEILAREISGNEIAVDAPVLTIETQRRLAAVPEPDTAPEPQPTTYSTEPPRRPSPFDPDEPFEEHYDL